MAIVANTFLTYSSIGNREDLTDLISMISPEDTPFLNNCGRGKMTATLHEWQTDVLAGASTTNAVVEGDETTFSAVVPTVRLGNRAQIQRKTYIISETEEVINKAGRKSEEAYQAMKAGAELRRDMESTALRNAGAVSGNSTTARELAGLGSWVRTNTNFNTVDGADPSAPTLVPVAGRTDGTLRTFTEAMLKDAMQQCFTSGAKPTTLMVGPVNKQRVSGFSGIAQIRHNVNTPKVAAIIGAADIYVSDFGNLAVVPNRFQRERDAWLLDFDFVEKDFLRPMKKVHLAKTGDAEKYHIITEWTLKVKNEAALGGVFDLLTT